MADYTIQFLNQRWLKRNRGKWEKDRGRKGGEGRGKREIKRKKSHAMTEERVRGWKKRFESAINTGHITEKVFSATDRNLVTIHSGGGRVVLSSQHRLEQWPGSIFCWICGHGSKATSLSDPPWGSKESVKELYPETTSSESPKSEEKPFSQNHTVFCMVEVWSDP